MTSLMAMNKISNDLGWGLRSWVNFFLEKEYIRKDLP